MTLCLVMFCSRKVEIAFFILVSKSGLHCFPSVCLLYLLSVDKDSDTITNQRNETIDNADQLKWIMEDAKPETDYEILLSAYTRVGDSTTEKAETRTAKPGGWSIIGSLAP